MRGEVCEEEVGQGGVREDGGVVVCYGEVDGLVPPWMG